MEIMQRYNLIENGMVNTEDLSLEWAEEMLDRYSSTFPNIEFWIEPVGYRG